METSEDSGDARLFKTRTPGYIGAYCFFWLGGGGKFYYEEDIESSV